MASNYSALLSTDLIETEANYKNVESARPLAVSSSQSYIGLI